jgi:hypothetical protein
LGGGGETSGGGGETLGGSVRTLDVAARGGSSRLGRRK